MVLCPTYSTTQMQAQSSQTTGSRKDLGFARQVRENGKGMAELKEYESERLKKGQNDLKSRGVNLGNQWALNKENGTTRGEIVLEGKRMNSL